MSQVAAIFESGRNCDGLDEGFLWRGGWYDGKRGIESNASSLWLFCFTDTAERMFFVVILPDGTVVEPRVAKRV
jgi:hypothetical protein